jgi:hypothetical protein
MLFSCFFCEYVVKKKCVAGVSSGAHPGAHPGVLFRCAFREELYPFSLEQDRVHFTEFNDKKVLFLYTAPLYFAERDKKRYAGVQGPRTSEDGARKDV